MDVNNNEFSYKRMEDVLKNINDKFPKEIIEEINCGIIVDETDLESVFSGMKMLVENPDLRFKMAENGLRAVKERYNWDRMEQKLIVAYNVLGYIREEKKNATHMVIKQC